MQTSSPQVILTNTIFAAALLPAGEALGTKVLDILQPGHLDILQTSSVLEALVIGFALCPVYAWAIQQQFAARFLAGNGSAHVDL